MAIQDFDKYLEKYHEARDAIKDRGLIAEIERFKRAHAAYQAALKSGGEPSFEDEAAVSRLYWRLMVADGAREYFESEKALVDTVAREMHTVASECDIDLSFLKG